MAIFNYSEYAFSSQSEQILTPRQKFNFSLILDRFDNASTVFTRVSSVTAPSFNVDSVLMNQYNKKRVVQTRLNYDPVTVTFYDTNDNEWHDIMTNYIAHYYNDGNGIARRTTLEGSETVNPLFETDLGYTPTADRYYFPKIRINQHGYRNEFREYTLINPIITGIDADTMDYSDSQPVMYSVTFQPESVQVRQVGS